jgi:hypothetical protein
LYSRDTPTPVIAFELLWGRLTGSSTLPPVIMPPSTMVPSFFPLGWAGVAGNDLGYTVFRVACW